MKKICFLVDSIFSIGGVQRVTAVIAKELAKYHDVTIISFDRQEQMDTSLYNLNEADINYRFFSYPTANQFKKKICRIYSGIYLKLQPKSKWCSDLYARSSYPSELRHALVTELKQGHYDIIIGVHAPLAARLASLRKELSGSKLIGWIHNSFEAIFGEDSHYFIGAKRKRHYIYQFQKLDHVVVLCQDDASKYHLCDNRFMPKVIYNPLTLKPDMPSSGNSKKFLTIGRFTPLHKGIDILIEAFSIFAHQNRDWHLDIVGEGVEETKYKTMIQQYQLEDRITIHPFTNQIQHYYSQAQVYVLSSRWEGMPLVLVEAMSHGLPIVASNLPVCEEILGDFGMFFKNKNIEDLAQRLEEATHIDWQQKSDEAIKIAQRFDISHIIEQWKRLLES
jgi:glycosyltransferase involved in cell wall biosynthesis